MSAEVINRDIIHRVIRGEGQRQEGVHSKRADVRAASRGTGLAVQHRKAVGPAAVVVGGIEGPIQAKVNSFMIVFPAMADEWNQDGFVLHWEGEAAILVGCSALN